MRNHGLNRLVAGIALALLSGAAHAWTAMPDDASAGGVIPYRVADSEQNQLDCSAVAAQFSTSFDQARMFSYSENTGFSPTLSDGLGATVNDSAKTLSWTRSAGSVGAVIVRAANFANVYLYDPQVGSDSALFNPLNASGRQRGGLNHLSFCWNEPVSCEWVGETAWSAGPRYTERGNWATFTAYSGEELSVDLYAGQHLEAGSVSFGEPSGGLVSVTIQLNAGWRFKDTAENVKIQDYAVAPAGNPAPGQFETKGYAAPAMSWFEILVPANVYYGVHVDVDREDCGSND